LSEHTVDVLIRARDSAIATLKEVNAEIQRTGKMSEETRQAYMATRQEIIQQNRALNTLKLAYREQHQTLNLTADAFQSVATTVGKAQRMYEQYNVAQIKTNQLAQQVKDAQEKYNQAVLQFGPNSQQAIKAQQDLKDASEKLSVAQKENVMQLIGFGLQAPAFLKNLIDVKDKFSVLRDAVAATDIGGWASGSAAALRAFAASASASLGGVAALFGQIALPAIGAVAWYQSYMASEKFRSSLALTNEEMALMYDLANKTRMSMGYLFEQVAAGTIDITRFGEEYAKLQEKLRKGLPLTVPTIAPTTAPTTQPPPTACPYCGGVGGHKPWCPILTNEMYGFQQGGIVTRPTLALLGERGPEAVVPLREGPPAPARTEVHVNVTISSLHVSDKAEVQSFFDELQRKIVRALR